MHSWLYVLDLSGNPELIVPNEVVLPAHYWVTGLLSQTSGERGSRTKRPPRHNFAEVLSCCGGWHVTTSGCGLGSAIYAGLSVQGREI
jgi:hypothetical protein